MNPNVQQVEKPRNEISESVPEASKSPLKPLSENQQYNIPSNQNKAQNRANFITLGKISEQERSEIIQRGFQLQAIAKQYIVLLREDKISLKKYYESTQQYSLFQRKGYFIKYETIRRTKLYTETKCRL